MSVKSGQGHKQIGKATSRQSIRALFGLQQPLAQKDGTLRASG
jgi:hypothetical protein